MSPTPVQNDVLRPPQVRRNNRTVVLQLLRRCRRMSRAELARHSGLTDGAVSRIVADLLRRRLIFEEGSQTATGGRPASNLQLDDRCWRSIGVDLHGSQARLAVGGLAGRILEDHSIRTGSSPSETLRRVVAQIQRWQEDEDSEGRKLVGVGISVPGVVNPVSGAVEIGHSRGWNNISLKSHLENQLPFPVHVENNARAAATAESVFGAPEIKTASNVLHIYVDEGIGIGLVLAGKLYSGSNMAAGEFGQMVVSDSPGPIEHQIPGCLEQLASNPAIHARYERLTGRPVGSRSKGAAAQVREICRLATDGDEAANQALTESCRYLGIGIANIIWGLAPDIVVVDGAITEAWELVRKIIQQQFPKGPEYLNFRNVSLRPSALGGEASLIGAMALPFDDFFSLGDPVSTLSNAAAPAPAPPITGP